MNRAVIRAISAAGDATSFERYGGVVMTERRADVRALFEVRELID